jgi:hypothetical protein
MSLAVQRDNKQRVALGAATTIFACTQHALRDGAKEKHRHGS